MFSLLSELRGNFIRKKKKDLEITLGADSRKLKSENKGKVVSVFPTPKERI